MTLWWDFSVGNCMPRLFGKVGIWLNFLPLLSSEWLFIWRVVYQLSSTNHLQNLYTLGSSDNSNLILTLQLRLPSFLAQILLEMNVSILLHFVISVLGSNKWVLFLWLTLYSTPLEINKSGSNMHFNTCE